MELRPYQKEAHDSIFEEWKKGVQKTLLVLPTGCGKTIVFAEVAKDCVKSGDRVLIMAHRGELLDQANDKIAKSTGLKCAVEKASETCLGSWFRIVVGSVQTLQREKRLEQFSKDYFDTIIIDEAHHCLSSGYQKVLEYFDTAKVLGVTATPDRGDMKNLGSYFESLAYQYTLPKAIKEGYLTPIKALTLPLKMDLSGVGVQSGDFKVSDIGTALDPYLEQIAQEMKKYCKDRKTVVFLPLVKTSQKFRDILNNNGFKAAEVNGDSKDRAEVLKDFENDKYNVLCNSMLLTEGWDCPSVDCIIVLRPTKVRSLYCLDTETEILTTNGWKKDVDIGEKVAAFDINTNTIQYVPALAKVRRKLGEDEYFCSIKGQSSDIRVTNKHRMLYDNRRRKGWKIAEAEYVANLKDGAYIPVCGNNQFKGVPLTPAELTFIGWVMTDGTINKLNNQITITQGEQQKEYCKEITKCIEECGFKYTKKTIKRLNVHWNAHGDCVIWTISKGAPRGRDKDKTGWGRLEPYLSKDLSEKLFDMTTEQFEIMLEAINHGDGRKNKWISYHIGKGNKTFIERLQLMAIHRGYRASISVEKANKVRHCDLWTLHIKKQNYVKIGIKLSKHSQWVKEEHTNEECWCVQNELGTLVTRRHGKVAILGNCQMVGRGTRLCKGKDHLLLLDFLWHTERHELCHPANLICENEEVAKKMTQNLETMASSALPEDVLEAIDIEEAEEQAVSDVVAQREESLAKQLAEMRKRKRKLVDPLQFEMSIMDQDLQSYVPTFGWEMAPASEKQIKALEKYGIYPDSVDNAGKATLLLDRLHKRQEEGLATPKQIRLLENKGFKQVGTWSFESARKLINRIAASGWRVPNGIDPATYKEGD